MKKIIISIICIITLCAIIFALSDNEKTVPASVAETPCGNRIYIFRNFNGFVACYEQGQSEPFLITQTKVENLRPLDEIMLSDGVEVCGSKAMSRALEDYCS